MEVMKKIVTENLFGEAQEYPITSDGKTHLGKIQKLKKSMGYRLSSGERKCKNCVSKCRLNYHDKTYYKCERIGFSNSEATDIRLKNVCDYWEAEGQNVKELK